MDSSCKMDIDSHSEQVVLSSSSSFSHSAAPSSDNQYSLAEATILTSQNRSSSNLDVNLNPITLEDFFGAEAFSYLGNANTFLNTEDFPSIEQETNSLENETSSSVPGGSMSPSSFSLSTSLAMEISNSNTNDAGPAPSGYAHGVLPDNPAEPDMNADIEIENDTHGALLLSSVDAPTESISSSPFASMFFDLSSNDQNNLADIYGLDNVERHNFDVYELLSLCGYRDDLRKFLPPISYPANESQETTKICIDDLDHEHCDLQGIDWVGMGISKDEARKMREETYKHHTNVLPLVNSVEKAHYQNLGPEMAARMNKLPKFANYFRFNQMNRGLKTRQIHFQLRHMISASSKNAVFLACGDRVQCANPQMDYQQCIMDFRKPYPDSEIRPIQTISTLSADNDLLVVGGYDGEYAFKSLLVEAQSPYTFGSITKDQNGSTNHVHTFLDRRSGLPQAVFSNNDRHVRVLDCQTNRFVSIHDIGWAVNCSATSPDARLRLIIGDNPSPWVVEAETGTRIAKLPNHMDYGFACAWSPNGFQMATGNQDEIVQIWDVRNLDEPIHILATDMAGVRTLQFSPLGEGKPVLALAEPADFVSIVDAKSFHERQRFEFFGEIGGISFTPDGSKFFVANTDSRFGGLLEFDRLRTGTHYDRWQRKRQDCDKSRGVLLDKNDSESGEDSGCGEDSHGDNFPSHRGLALDHLII